VVLDFSRLLFLHDCEFDGFICQATTFAEQITSGALTSEFVAERRRLEGRVERLRTQYTEAVRDKSVTKNKSRNLAEKLATVKAEKEDLGRRLVAEKEDADRACAEAQAARAEAKLAHAEANLALQRLAEAEASHSGLRSYLDKAEASTRTEVGRAHALLMDAYRQLGARTAPFDASGKEVGLCFLGWLQEELEVLPSIVTGLMSFASLITCEGTANALAHEGCRHFEVFDQSDKDFDRRIFQVEDAVIKRSAGVLYDRMWGPHGRDTVRERSDRAMEQVRVFCFFGMCVHIWCYFCRWLMMGRSRTSEA
jgi:hypothetical protein